VAAINYGQGGVAVGLTKKTRGEKTAVQFFNFGGGSFIFLVEISLDGPAKEEEKGAKSIHLWEPLGNSL